MVFKRIALKLLNMACAFFVPPLHTFALTAKVSFSGIDIGGQEGGQVTLDQNNHDSSSGFDCGSIDIKGSGPSGPSDFGGAASFVAILSLPFILRWRNYGRILNSR